MHLTNGACGGSSTTTTTKTIYKSAIGRIKTRIRALKIFNIHWHDFDRNVDVRCPTEQPPLSSIITSRRLWLFGHLARMDETADVNQILFQPTTELQWRSLVDRAPSCLRISVIMWPPLTWGCWRPEMQLRFDHSAGWWLRIALHTRSGAADIGLVRVSVCLRINLKHHQT